MTGSTSPLGGHEQARSVPGGRRRVRGSDRGGAAASAVTSPPPVESGFSTSREVDSFETLGLASRLRSTIASAGFEVPTRVQARAIPIVLGGDDVIVSAQTGTGKTAAYLLPILEQLRGRCAELQHPLAVILAPTRELARQIADASIALGGSTGVEAVAVYGGSEIALQIATLLGARADLLVATPGRLIDLINRGVVSLDQVKTLVLDEADQMLQLDFGEQLDRIRAELPPRRQSLLFSATMPPAVHALAQSILQNPVRIEIDPGTPIPSQVQQWLYMVDVRKKPDLLLHLLDDPNLSRVMVFVGRKDVADLFATVLKARGISAGSIHSDLSQPRRDRTMDRFRDGGYRVLVGTDVMSRGIDVDGVTHVINVDLPLKAETYLHRIGRTGRAGSGGMAITFVEEKQRARFRQMQRDLGIIDVPEVRNHPYRAPPRPSSEPRSYRPRGWAGGAS